MAELIRKYWIAGLVVLLVVVHGSIIGYIRAQASRLQVTSSREYEMGEYTIMAADGNSYTRMKLFALLPPNRRLQGRITLQQNTWQLHEAIEEYLRSMDQELLQDPILQQFKKDLLHVATERLGMELIEEILVTELIQTPVERIPLPSSFSPRIYVKRTVKHDEHDAHGEGGEHGDAHGDEHGESHGEESEGHGGHDEHASSEGGEGESHAEPDELMDEAEVPEHAATPEPSSSHGAPKASGHGEAKKSAH